MVVDLNEVRYEKTKNKIKNVRNDIREIAEEMIQDVCSFLYEEDFAPEEEFEKSLEDLEEAIKWYRLQKKRLNKA